MATQPSSPPISPSSTSEVNRQSQTEKPTSIDLWNVPALVNPSPPSNTLLITNLKSPHIFSAASLQNLYNLLNDPVPLNSFAPLPSLRRIIISYPTIEAAVATRQLLEQSSSLPTPPSPPTISNADTTTTTIEGSNGTDPEQEERGHQQQQQNHEPTPTTAFHPMKIYFGETTPLVGQYAAGSGAPDQHLQAPSLGRLMFISPPPSPPCGWEIRDEDPPNKTTHAEDLLAALAGLGGNNNKNNNNNYNHNHNHNDDNNDDRNDGITTSTATTIDNDNRKMRKEGSNSEDETATAGEANEHDREPTLNGKKKSGHRRKGTLTVYHPRDHGDSADLPAVVVEDTTAATETDAPGYDNDGDVDMDDEMGESEPGIKALPTRTARPPVELMDVA